MVHTTYFDWDYIDECREALNDIQNEEAIRQLQETSEGNVLNFPVLV